MKPVKIIYSLILNLFLGFFLFLEKKIVDLENRQYNMEKSAESLGGAAGANWKALMTSKGRIYFYNDVTGVS